MEQKPDASMVAEKILQLLAAPAPPQTRIPREQPPFSGGQQAFDGAELPGLPRQPRDGSGGLVAARPDFPGLRVAARLHHSRRRVLAQPAKWQAGDGEALPAVPAPRPPARRLLGSRGHELRVEHGRATGDKTERQPGNGLLAGLLELREQLRPGRNGRRRLEHRHGTHNARVAWVPPQQFCGPAATNDAGDEWGAGDARFAKRPLQGQLRQQPHKAHRFSFQRSWFRFRHCV
mmetsp:Transcript_19096/g.47759  ORF Transcript_19096/g.47759 Transcript_19096/m.47759 type:complete len:233 (-) Transcript_19096:464-1162(-)